MCRPDVLEDAGWSTGGSQGAAPAVKTPAVDETGHSLVLDSQPEGMEHAQVRSGLLEGISYHLLQARLE